MPSILITGICGFAGSRIAEALLEGDPSLAIAGVDNLSRRGSEWNRDRLERLGVRVIHGDLRCSSDLDTVPRPDWVVDAAANPSVLAGIDGRTSSRQLVEHNLSGTINLIEACKTWGAGLILLSTSRVYSMAALAAIPVIAAGSRFDLDSPLPAGVTTEGIGESFPTTAPVSLYGSTKLASEVLALEYGAAFDFPVWVNRCGNLAGAGQFGTPDQGVFAFWIHAHLARGPLRYTGFGGKGLQVRDLLHPRDLAALIVKQMAAGSRGGRLFNVAGGAERSISLAELTAWCDARFGPHAPESALGPRPFDIPWVTLDSSLARRAFDWSPEIPLESVLGEIARHAESDPEWLNRCGVR